MKVTGSNINPYDIVDQAEEELSNLKSVIQGEITVAHSSLKQNLGNYQYVVSLKNKYTSIEGSTEYQNILVKIVTLRELGISGGISNPDSCIKIPQQDLDSAYNSFSSSLLYCLDGYSDESQAIIDDSTYRVDIVFSKVNSLDFQLLQCGGELSCLSSLLILIQNYFVKLPQDIEVEVNTAINFLDVLTAPVNECFDTKLSSFVSHANVIFGTMETCINNMLSHYQ